MSEIQIPNDPVELAAPCAEESSGQQFEITTSDHVMLAKLDHVATKLGFLGTRYFLNAHVGFQIPVNYDANELVTYTKFEQGLTAEAILATHAKVHIGRIVGGGAVRAVCLCFSEGFVLNSFTEIPEDQLLYVPVLAINEISQTW